ncbi:hypothetical protein BDZ89DRAFT_466012 [Hymenopellis radicata]|nr:hypothetical protein BDZ89DRAFT_466012 [Hymenopellis radicata]
MSGRRQTHKGPPRLRAGVFPGHRAPAHAVALILHQLLPEGGHDTRRPLTPGAPYNIMDLYSKQFSIFFDIDSMVKFSAGMRENAANVNINRATEIVKSEAFEDCIRCVATTKRIRSRGDTLNAATFTLDCYNVTIFLPPSQFPMLSNSKRVIGKRTSLPSRDPTLNCFRT